MKKLLSVVAVLVVLAGGLYMVYQKNYGGDIYYVKITQDGMPRQSRDDSGRIYTDYNYELPAVNKRNVKKATKFTADHNLRKGAYLELTVNKTKGVTGYKEVKKSEIKASILKEIN
ncbi:YxeA family protein [Pseudolactococcus yaeyamensis]